MIRDTIISDTREDILAEIDVLTADMEAQVMDTESADDSNGDPIRALRRVEMLEKRIKAFDKYGVNSMDELKADPVFVRDNLLFKAMHGVVDGAKRWQQRREKGLTDDELMEAYLYEIGGSYYGYSAGPDSFECRPNLFIYRGLDGVKHELKGSALVRLLREVLQIPVPAGRDNVAVEQLSMFSEP